MPNLLDQLKNQGLTFTLDQGRLLVTPRSAITPAMAELIREHKPALVAALQARQAEPGADLDDMREFYEKRAAIIEYDGGLPKPEAEAHALHLACVRFNLYQGEGGGYVVAPGKTIAEVINNLKVRYGNCLDETLGRVPKTGPLEGTYLQEVFALALLLSDLER